MKKILISAAAIALLSGAPAFAQNDEHHGHGGGQGEQQGGQQPGHGAQGGGAPRAMSAEHPDRNPNHGPMGGGTGGQHPMGAAQPAPQVTAQPNAGMQHGTGHRGDNNMGNGMAGPNRNMGNGGMAGPNRNAGNGMAGPNLNMGMGHNGPRVTNFNSYHRNFRSPQRYHLGGYRRPQGWYAHRWTFGERLLPAFFARDYWIDDYSDYGLVEPPYGTTWVRYGNDALLIDEDSGEVIQVAYGVFY